jgi:23S rRNA (uracil1939-C5)-methyltransferase
VNQSLNPLMVRQALDFLDLTPKSVVLDLFCGLGNFTLPLARLAGQVVGVEGDEAMTIRAALNAKNNGLSNVSFFAENLFEPFADKPFFVGQSYDRVLMDPPRAGALEVCTTLAGLKKKAPQKIVYISCNPSTLARDAGVLVKGGYVMTHAGVMDMFPHTDHVESMAVFEKRE